jgi:type I restriction enzyme S subunit
MPLKAVASYAVSSVNKIPEDGETRILLCNYTDVYNHEFIDSRFNFMPSTATRDEIKKFRVAVDDVIITKDSESWDDIAVPALVTETTSDLICGYHLAILRPTRGRLLGRFLFRCLQAKPIRVQLELASATGVTRFGIPKHEIGRFLVPVPPVEQQRAIADFLDWETAKIDDLVARKERILALIDERKRSTQFRLVTGAYSAKPKRKATDPRLPPVPEHWTAEKLGYLARMVSGGTPSKENPAFWKGEVPWVSAKDMKVQFLSDSEDHITQEAVLAASLDLLPTSTLLIVVRGMILAHSLPVCLLLRPATINQDLKGLRFNSRCNPEFMLAWFQGMAQIMHALIEESAHGTRCLRTDLLKHVAVHLPPIEEQAQIVRALNADLARLDEVARPISAAIALLHEYRAALISAAVTGQLDVRKHEERLGALA